MVGGTRNPVVGEVQRFLDETTDMAASCGVDPPPAVLSHSHEAGQSEFGKVLARGRRRRACRLSECADIVLAATQHEEHPEPSGVGEEREGSHGRVHLRSARQVGCRRRHERLKDVRLFAHACIRYAVWPVTPAMISKSLS